MKHDTTCCGCMLERLSIILVIVAERGEILARGQRQGVPARVDSLPRVLPSRLLSLPLHLLLSSLRFPAFPPSPPSLPFPRRPLPTSPTAAALGRAGVRPAASPLFRGPPPQVCCPSHAPLFGYIGASAPHLFIIIFKRWSFAFFRPEFGCLCRNASTMRCSFIK